jgi:16S rRNA G966 N2-methylase RsmD
LFFRHGVAGAGVFVARGVAGGVIERDRGALHCLRQNIDALGLKDKTLILPIDAYAMGEHPDLRDFVVAFVDPPYSHMESGHLRHKVDGLVKTLAARSLVDGGIISRRHPARVSVDPAAMGVKVIRVLTFGAMAITWVTPVKADP